MKQKVEGRRQLRRPRSSHDLYIQASRPRMIDDRPPAFEGRDGIIPGV